MILRKKAATYFFIISTIVYTPDYFPTDTLAYENFRIRVPEKCNNCKSLCDVNGLCQPSNAFKSEFEVGDLYANNPKLKGKTDAASLKQISMFRYFAQFLGNFDSSPVWDAYLLSIEIDFAQVLSNSIKTNNNILFAIHNLISTSYQGLSMTDIMPNDPLKYAVLSCEYRERSLRFYIGSNLSKNYINYNDILFNGFKSLKKILIQVYLDGERKFGKIVVYLDDLRAFGDIKLNWSPDPISYTSMIYSHPAVSKMRVYTRNPRFSIDFFENINNKSQDSTAFTSSLCGKGSAATCQKCTTVTSSTYFSCDKCKDGYSVFNSRCYQTKYSQK